MKKKIGQSLKKCCSLALAVLLMFNTSSLQTFAEVLTMNGDTEAVEEQIEVSEDDKVSETAKEAEEIEVSEVIEVTETAESEEMEMAETAKADVIETEASESSEIPEVSTVEETDEVVENAETAKVMEINTPSETAELNADEYGITELHHPNDEKIIVTLLEVTKVDGSVTTLETIDDGRETPYKLELKTNISLSVSFEDKAGNAVSKDDMSENELEKAKKTIKEYLGKLDVDAYAQNGNDKYSLLNSGKPTDVLSLFMEQYLSTATTEAEIELQRKEAETRLNELLDGLINNSQCQIELVGNTVISAGDYKFNLEVTCNDENNITITNGTMQVQSETYPMRKQDIVEVTSQEVYVGHSYIQAIVGNNADITYRKIMCTAYDTTQKEVDESVVEIDIDQDKKEVIVTPKVEGTYKVQYKLESNTSYEESNVIEQTIVAEVQPYWDLNAVLNEDEVSIEESVYCIISTEELNISKQELTWKVFEKINGEYVEIINPAGEIEIWKDKEYVSENGTSIKANIHPHVAKEFNIEFTLSGDEDHKATMIPVPFTVEKYEWQSVIQEPQVNMTALKEYTYSFKAEKEDISGLALPINIKEQNADGDYVVVGGERVGYSVEKGADKNVIVKVTPKVSGNFKLCYTYPETEKYKEKSGKLDFSVGKTAFPGEIEVTSTGKREAINGITYTVKTTEADISAFNLVCKTYKKSGDERIEVFSETVEVSDVINNSDSKEVTITPKEAGEFEFEFILTGNETYNEKSKSVNEKISHTDSPATVERKTKETVVATSSTCYQLVGNGALQAQEIVGCEATIETEEATYRKLDSHEFEYEINNAKNAVIVTPKIAGNIHLTFTLKENAVYRKKEYPTTLEVVKLAQPREIMVEQRCEEGKEGTAIAGEKVTYEIKDAAEPECDITKRQLVWTIRDTEGNVLCTNAAGVSAAAGRPQFQVEETTGESTTKRTIDVIPGASGEYTIEFKLVEDATYTEAVTQAALSVSKAEFSGTITPIGAYTKTNPLKIYVEVNAGDSELFQSCYEEMELVFYAIYKEDGGQKKVELTPSYEEGAVNGWQPMPEGNEGQSKCATYIRTVDPSITENFKQGKEYTIEAEFVWEENYPYRLKDEAKTIVSEAFKAKNGTLDIVFEVSGADIKNTYSLEYKENEFDTINLVAREVIGDNEYSNNLLYENSRVGYTVEKGYENLLNINQDNVSSIQIQAIQEVRTGLRVLITADDKCTEECSEGCSDCGIYNRGEKWLTVNITSPKTTGFTMTYQDSVSNTIEGLYNKAFEVKSNGTTEHWYADAVTVKPDNSFYNYIAYIELDKALSKEELDVSPDWKFVQGSWTISKQELKNYAFYFFHLPEGDTIGNMTSAQICDKYFNTREADNKYNTLESVGIDITAPIIENELFTKVAPSKYSEEDEKYFPQKVSLFAYASDGTEKIDCNTKNKMDAQSGIKSVEYLVPGTTDDWRLVSSEADMEKLRYAANYKYQTEQSFGEVALCFTDYAGNKTKVYYCGTYLEEGEDYTSKVKPEEVSLCVDKNHPVVSVAEISVKGINNYNEKDWTNQQITYVLNEIPKDENQPSGIQKYQYIFVERGTEFEPDKVEWTTLKKNQESGKYEFTIGEKLDSNTKTRDGEFNYTTDDLDQNVSYTASKCLNGYLYVRAVSKAGLYSTTDSMDDNKRETHIWQNDLGIQDVKASIKPADTKWYNAKTGEVAISFTYPTYLAEHYAPPVGLEIKVTTETANEYGENKKVAVEESVYYKGIFDENASEPKVIEGKATVNEKKNSIKVNTKKSLADTASFVVSEDCIKTIEVTLVDAAGNKSDTCKYVVSADFNAPSIEDVVFTAGGQEMKLTKNNEGLNTKLTDSIAYNFFAGSDVTVKANAIYGVSGAGEMTLQQCKNIGDWEKKNSKNQNDNNVITSDTMTLQPNTRGFVYVTAKDAA